MLPLPVGPTAQALRGHGRMAKSQVSKIQNVETLKNQTKVHPVAFPANPGAERRGNGLVFRVDIEGQEPNSQPATVPPITPPARPSPQKSKYPVIQQSSLFLSSRAPKDCKDALEKLLFFNPRQHIVRDGIIESLKQFGHPRVEEGEDGLKLRIGDHEVQTLFAFDRKGRKSVLAGAIIFLRTAHEEISVLHVAVDPKYALQGKKAGMGLGVMLVEQVKEIASRIVGIKRIVFFYRQQVVIRLK
jgi:hypothetical protein